MANILFMLRPLSPTLAIRASEEMMLTQWRSPSVCTGKPFFLPLGCIFHVAKRPRQASTSSRRHAAAGGTASAADDPLESETRLSYAIQ